MIVVYPNYKRYFAFQMFRCMSLGGVQFYKAFQRYTLKMLILELFQN